MDSEKMNELLNKYWEGETSLEEEATLIAYFNEGEVAEEHKAYAPAFQLFGNYRKTEMPAGFEERLQSKLTAVPASAPSEKVVATRGRVINIRRAMSIAASFVLLVTATYFLMPTLMGNQKSDLYTDTFESPEEAAAEIRMALGMLSAKVNESTAMIEDGFKKLDEANNLSY